MAKLAREKTGVNSTETNFASTRPLAKLGERKATQRAVPAPSREATARKLELEDVMEVLEVTEELEIAPGSERAEIENLKADEAAMPVALKSRGRASQSQAIAGRAKINEEAAQHEQERLETIEKLETKRDNLVTRLDNGASRIEVARAKGQDVQEWEDYWILLLREYEQTSDKLRELTKVY